MADIIYLLFLHRNINNYILTLHLDKVNHFNMNLKFDAEHTFFTSDTHFNHANIIHFSKRPFKNVEQMNEMLIANWNRVVHADDTVFHLGDFCLGGAAEWTRVLDRLNGHIYLILGNHDLKNIRQDYYQRFEYVSMQMFITVGKQAIILNHNPFLYYSGSYKDTWQLFGHVHSGPFNIGIDKPRLNMLFPLQYDVGVDNNNYTPVSFEQVKRIINKQVEQQKKK